METKGVAIPRTVLGVLGALTAAMLLLTAAGCHIVDQPSPWERYYNADKYGTTEKEIRDHFNMHRGRWWNYYTLGACYLEHGHYKKARCEFKKVMRIRPHETRDARMYGMHFVDYFPHRERGIAFYLEGMSETGEGVDEELLRTRKTGLFEQAIAELTESIDQGESSRAKYYLNRARKAFFQLSKEDLIAPVIRVRSPIYTNQRVFQLGLTVTDEQSGVEEIWIRPAGDGTAIDRCRLLLEPAPEEAVETVELTIDSKKRAAAVEIEAFDLAGNRSNKQRVDIILDSQSPVATVTFVGDLSWQSRFGVLVQAVDDSGLQEIRVGGGQNNRLACNGEKRYRGTVFGSAVNGEMNISIADIAGNTVVASLPVWQNGGRAMMPRTHRFWRAQMYPLARLAATSDWGLAFHPAPLAGSTVHQPYNAALLNWGGLSQDDSATFSAMEAASQASWNHEPHFYFKEYVKPTDGKAKETSQDCFVVEGTLRNAWGVTAIRVDGENIYPAIFGRASEWSGSDLIFRHQIDLDDDDIDHPKVIEVRAFRAGNCCAKTTLTVIRRNNCVRDSDAVYRAVLLLKSGDTAYRLGAEDAVIPRNFYDAVLTSIKKLDTVDPYGRVPLERIRIQDLSLALGEKYQVVAKMSVDTVLRKVRSSCDLVIHGDVGVYTGIEGEELEIKLRAMDIVAERNLRFQPLEEEPPVILAETHVPHGISDVNDWAESMAKLGAAVEKKLPRVAADADTSPTGASGSTVRINRGTEVGLFQAMSVCLYAYGDTARSSNVYIKKIGFGRIATPNRQSSNVHHQVDLTPYRDEDSLIVITK